MVYTIHNEFANARIAALGAELIGFQVNSTNREYIWQGGEPFNGHAPILFPAVGRIDRSRTIIRGQECHMPMHGFAKDMAFDVESIKPDSITLNLTSNKDTFRFYPCDFNLQVRYALAGDKLKQQFRITNNGAEEMYFSLGVHPAFYCPVVLGELAEDYVLRFDKPQTTYKIRLEKGTRLTTLDKTPWLNNETDIPLSDMFFNAGPIVSGGYNASSVTLLSLKSGTGIRMAMENFPYMTFWGPAGRLPLICVEPWCGLSDFAGMNHIWENKPAAHRLMAKDIFCRELSYSPVNAKF